MQRLRPDWTRGAGTTAPLRALLVVIHVDTREPKDMRVLIHRALCGESHTIAECERGLVTVRKLDSGDYSMFDKDGCYLGIERKTVTDMLGSLQHKQANGNKRLYDQLERMGLEYTHRALLIEGDLGYGTFTKRATIVGKYGIQTDTGWWWSSIEMMLWGWECEGISIFHAPSKEATIELLRILHQRAEKGCILPHSLRASLAAAA